MFVTKYIHRPYTTTDKKATDKKMCYVIIIVGTATRCSEMIEILDRKLRL